MAGFSFDDVLSTVMSATIDTFKSYMNIDLLSGEVDKRIDTLESDITGIVGIGGERVGYIIIAANKSTARLVAQQMLMADDPDDNDITDAIGELANNIAGAVKTNHAACGNVALGLPLIVVGQLRAVSEPPSTSDDPSISVQCKGVAIPFQTSDGKVKLKVMVYM
jgi:CheY-specific phosphatase CheX